MNIDITELLRLLRLAWGTDHVSAEDCKKIDAILDVPPEDIRAVVDEPVAWAVTWADDGDFYKLIRDKERAHKFLVDSDFAVLPLYRHPHRPVVIPERREEAYFPEDTMPEDRLWNSFCDEFTRLNPE